MKRIMAIVIAILGVLVTGSTAARAQTNAYVQHGYSETRSEQTFRASELTWSVYGGWVDKDDSKFAPGLGLTYYMTRNFGVGATLALENYDGSFIDNLAAEGYYRFPICDRWAPYAVAGIGYSFESEDVFGYFGGGLEYRLSHHMGVFGDVTWHLNNDESDGVGFRVGVRFGF